LYQPPRFRKFWHDGAVFGGSYALVVIHEKNSLFLLVLYSGLCIIKLQAPKGVKNRRLQMKERYKALSNWEIELITFIDYKLEEDKTYTVSDLLNEGYLHEILGNLFIELEEERQQEQNDILIDWYETQKEEQK
jgi:hypothetical protein